MIEDIKAVKKMVVGEGSKVTNYLFLDKKGKIDPVQTLKANLLSRPGTVLLAGGITTLAVMMYIIGRIDKKEYVDGGFFRWLYSYGENVPIVKGFF